MSFGKRACEECTRYFFMMRRAQRFCANACRYNFHNHIRRNKLAHYARLMEREKKANTFNDLG